jgi:hypothetical protein
VNWISKETKQVGRSFSATAPSTTMATTLVDDLVHFRRGRRRHSRWPSKSCYTHGLACE